MRRRAVWAAALLTVGACLYFSAKWSAAVSRARSLGRAARLAARARKLDEDELLAEPTLLAELAAMLELWQSDFLSARVAGDALCRISRPGRVKDKLHELGVTRTLSRAISRSAEQDNRPNMAQQYRGRLVRFDGAQAAAPGQLPGQLPFAPRPFALVQDVFLALASSLSDGGGRSRLTTREDAQPEAAWDSRQDGLLSAVPALLKLATEGPVVICVAHPHAPQQAPAARARQNIRIWMELENTPDPRALVTCVNIAQGRGPGNTELHRRQAGAAFSTLASTKRWRGALQRVWTRKDQAFLRMVAGMGVGFILGPRVGKTPPTTGWRTSRPLLRARRARVRTLRVESAVIDRLVRELVGAVRLAETHKTETEAEAAEGTEDEIACGVEELVHAIAMLLLERHNRRAFAQSTAAPVMEDEPSDNPNNDGGGEVEVVEAVDGLEDNVSDNAEGPDHSVDDEHNDELGDESESDEDEDHWQHSSDLPTQSPDLSEGLGIGALLRVCSHPSRPMDKRGRVDRTQAHPPPHYLAATSIWRIALDTDCRLLLETQLRHIGIEWSLAPSVCARRIDASAEPIDWQAERIVWVGWWSGRGRSDASCGSTGADECAGPADKRSGAGPLCWFALLSQELMRCIVRELRPIGLRNEYTVFAAN